MSTRPDQTDRKYVAIRPRIPVSQLYLKTLLEIIFLLSFRYCHYTALNIFQDRLPEVCK
jgi:hypothetical protein